MPCYHPITAWRAHGECRKDVGAKHGYVWPLTFNRNYGVPGTEKQVPCGQCIGCRLEHSRMWAVRCVHEASQYKNNVFITLTFNDENLPPTGSIDVRDLQLFFKRLRKKSSSSIRYFAAGEYGTLLSRPHYHAILFSVDFPDKYPWMKNNGQLYYRSSMLEKLWPFGYSSIGSVTFESAAYVARYVLKKQKGMTDDELKLYYNGRRPEFVVMSRRPGLGYDWISKYYRQVAEQGYILVRHGIRSGVPRFYEDFIFLNYPDLWKKFDYNRSKIFSKKDLQDARNDDRMLMEEMIKYEKSQKLLRSYNSGRSVLQ